MFHDIESLGDWCTTLFGVCDTVLAVELTTSTASSTQSYEAITASP